MKNLGFVLLAWTSIVVIAPLRATAAPIVPAPQKTDVAAIYVRAKGGVALYSNVDPVAMSMFTLGLDLGFRAENGFGVAASAKRNFLGSGTAAIGTTSSLRTEVTSLFLGVVPSYSVTKGIATLSFGLGAGVVAVTTQVDSLGDAAALSTPEITRSRFALAPSIDADFEIVQGLFANVSVQYVVGLGESPIPGFFAPMAGIGYRF